MDVGGAAKGEGEAEAEAEAHAEADGEGKLGPPSVYEMMLGHRIPAPLPPQKEGRGGDVTVDSGDMEEVKEGVDMCVGSVLASGNMSVLCRVLQCLVVCCCSADVGVGGELAARQVSHWHCNTLQHAATHCNTLQHTATRSKHVGVLLQCVLLQCVVLPCIVLLHCAVAVCCCSVLLQCVCKTRQHTATHCNNL